MRVAERGDADTGDEVEILAAVDIIEARATAAYEGDRLTLVGRHHVLRFERLDPVERPLLHRTTCVHPASGPFAAASASSLTSRPLAMSTSPTPFRSAARQASSFATMPLFAVPALIICAARRESRRAIVCPASSSTPDVPPAMTSRFAPSDDARCAASVSAFTFRSCPSRVAPM